MTRPDSVCVHECATSKSVVTFRADGEASVAFLDVDGLWVPIVGESLKQVDLKVQHPGMPTLCRKAPAGRCDAAHAAKS